MTRDDFLDHLLIWRKTEPLSERSEILKEIMDEYDRLSDALNQWVAKASELEIEIQRLGKLTQFRSKN